MDKKGIIEPEPKYGKGVEDRIAAIIVDSEFSTFKSNQGADVADYASYVDQLLDMLRTEKNSEWMSDIAIPEGASILLTEASSWANQYFQSRDFVEVRLEAEGEAALAKCRAAKNCINKQLNIREMYHYPKYMRGRLINSLSKTAVYAVEWWDQKVRQTPIAVNRRYDMGDDNQPKLDASGNPVIVEEPVYEDHVVRDHYNYEVIDPADVFTDNSYVYNVQDKDCVIIRSEKSVEELEASADTHGYINLDILKMRMKGNEGETEKSQETYNEYRKDAKADKAPEKRTGIIERYGKFWVMVTNTDPDGFPTAIEPGYDEQGNVKKDAEYIETVIGFAPKHRVMVRFQAQKNKTPKGEAYRPILRGMCYIHPRKDSGLSDGMFLKDLQVAVNDNFNMSFDRTKMSLLPTVAIKESLLSENADQYYFEPEHFWPVKDVNTDVKEFRINDNIQASLEQDARLTSKMQQVTAVWPTTMGQAVGKGTTATAVAGAESRGNLRDNYKSLTYEYTFLLDQYAHMLWMTYQYAKDETKMKLMGEDVYHFDPSEDYTYTPVTSNIEQEHSKKAKLQIYEQMLGRLSAFAANPKVYALVNRIISRMFELQGDEFSEYKDALLDENAPPEGKGQDVKDMAPPATSNQAGIEQSIPEQNVRSIFSGER